MANPARRRPRLAAVFLVILVPVLGACGFNYQTDQVYQPSVGVNNREGTVDVLGAVVVSGTDGDGTFVASLVNKDQDKTQTLTAIKGADGIEVTLVKPVEVPPGQLVNLAEMGAASVHGHAIQAGGFARLDAGVREWPDRGGQRPDRPTHGAVLRDRPGHPVELTDSLSPST